jgi:hypothetical protein
MDDFVITAAAFNLLYAMLAAVAVWLGLLYLDKSINVKFSETAAIIRQDPRATAIYYGARVIAVCLLFGLVIG